MKFFSKKDLEEILDEVEKKFLTKKDLEKILSESEKSYIRWLIFINLIVCTIAIISSCLK